jgi:hypothetical protein
VEVCPTNSIIELNFPPRKIKTDLPPMPAQEAEASVLPQREATGETGHTENTEIK